MSRLILRKSRAFDWLKIIRCKSQASNPKNEGIQTTDGQSEGQKLNTPENNVSSDLTANPEKILYPEKFKEKITPYKEHFHFLYVEPLRLRFGNGPKTFWITVLGCALKTSGFKILAQFWPVRLQ